MAKVKQLWSPIAQFPVTQILSKCLPKRNVRVASKSHIVSEKLCDDVLQRLSPFLLRNPPVDILDLWPGAGVLSSKVNEFLKPRRHVLIEPDLEYFKPVLEPLAKSRPCYELLSTDVSSIQDWQSVLSEHFPEQGPSNADSSGALPRNDTLLVLAHPPPPKNRRDHFTGARWWSVFMETCMRQAGLHSYGSVRLLATMSMGDSHAVIPRMIGERTRPALLTEQLALHAFMVASPKDPTVGQWALSKRWDMLMDCASRVAQRTAEQNVVISPGRAYPPVEQAPESPEPGRKPTPYTPRVKTLQHDKYLEAFEAFDKTDPESPGYAEAKKKRTRAAIQLNQENRYVCTRNALADKQAEIDELNKSISRLAADPTTDSATLQPIVQQIETAEAALDQEISQHHFDLTRPLPALIDDRRAAFHRDTFDKALLLWDRRPFEPLLIHTEELYPRDNDRTLLYFEADPNPPAIQKLNRLTPEQRDTATRFFTAFSLSLTTQHTLTVSKLLSLIFPDRSTNSIVQAVPTLAQYASKRPKPDFNSLPKTLHPDPDETTQAHTENPDPLLCYQENLDYDLSDVHIRLLSPSTLWDLSVEYAKTGADHSAVQLNRLLGGTLTSAQLRDFVETSKKERLH